MKFLPLFTFFTFLLQPSWGVKEIKEFWINANWNLINTKVSSSCNNSNLWKINPVIHAILHNQTKDICCKIPFTNSKCALECVPTIFPNMHVLGLTFWKIGRDIRNLVWKWKWEWEWMINTTWRSANLWCWFAKWGSKRKYIEGSQTNQSALVEA